MDSEDNKRNHYEYICTVDKITKLTPEMCIALFEQKQMNGGRLSDKHAQHIVDEFTPSAPTHSE